MKKLLFLIFILSGAFQSFGQSLSEKISLNESNKPIGEILKTIESKSELRFSYDSQLLAGKEKMNYQASNMSIQSILQDILGPEISWKQKGKYVVLKKKNAEKKHFYIFGYIIDGETGDKLQNVSIYEPVSFSSSLSDMHGYYKIKLLKSQEDIDLRFQKAEYKVRIKEIPVRDDKKFDISMAKLAQARRVILEVEPLESIKVKEDTVKLKPETAIDLSQLNIETETQEEAKTKIREQIKLPKIDISEQFSGLDSTFKKGKENVSGHIANLDSTIKRGKENFMTWMMSSKQIFHSKNISDSLYKAVQVSFVPYIGTNLRLGPFVTNDYSFNMVAGFTGNVNKLEIGGAVNVIRQRMSGVQIAGAANFVGEEMRGTQIAGASNFNFGSADGLLMAGATNLNFENSSGVHIAGGLNFTRKTHRVLQLDPFNYAKEIKGTQIGVFNFSQDASQGLPFGVFSYVKNGYRRWELNVSELNNTELTFKTGVPKLYNVFSAAYNFNTADKPLFGFGYGLGTARTLGKRLALNLDLVTTTYLPQNQSFESIDYWSQQFQLNAGLEAKLGKRLAVFGGPTLNLDHTFDESLNFSKYKLFIAQREVNWNSQSANLYSWVGFKAGIRLCNKV